MDKQKPKLYFNTVNLMANANNGMLAAKLKYSVSICTEKCTVTAAPGTKLDN